MLEVLPYDFLYLVYADEFFGDIGFDVLHVLSFPFDHCGLDVESDLFVGQGVVGVAFGEFGGYLLVGGTLGATSDGVPLVGFGVDGVAFLSCALPAREFFW